MKDLLCYVMVESKASKPCGIRLIRDAVKGLLRRSQHDVPINRRHKRRPFAFDFGLVENDVRERIAYAFIKHEIVPPTRLDKKARLGDKPHHVAGGKPGTVDDCRYHERVTDIHTMDLYDLHAKHELGTMSPGISCCSQTELPRVDRACARCI